MDFLSITGNRINFKPDNGNTNGAEKIKQAHDELASIFEQKDNITSEIETTEIELAQDNAQEQQQVQEITNALTTVQTQFEQTHSAAVEADSNATSAQHNASALAAYAASLSHTISVQVQDGYNEEGQPIYTTQEVANPEYYAAQDVANAAQAEAEALRNQANELKSQEAELQSTCNDMIEELSELSEVSEEGEEEQDAELEALKEQYEEFSTKIEELNQEIAEFEAQQQAEEVPDEAGIAVYRHANKIEGREEKFIDNEDGSRTIINPNGTRYTISKDTNGNTVVADSEGNNTTYKFNKTEDGEVSLNSTTTKNADGTTSTTMLDEDGTYDTQKTNEQDRVIYEQNENKGKDKNTITTSLTDVNTGIKTTVDEKGNVVYTDKNDKEIIQEEKRYEEYDPVAETDYSEPLQDTVESAPEVPVDIHDVIPLDIYKEPDEPESEPKKLDELTWKPDYPISEPSPAQTYTSKRNEEISILKNVFKKTKNKQGVLGLIADGFKNFFHTGNCSNNIKKEISALDENSSEEDIKKVKEKLDKYNSNQDAAVNGIANTGAMIAGSAAGGKLGAMVGTAIFPGAGTIVCTAFGVLIGAGIGAVASVGIHQAENMTDKVKGNSWQNDKNLDKEIRSGAISGGSAVLMKFLPKKLTSIFASKLGLTAVENGAKTTFVALSEKGGAKLGQTILKNATANGLAQGISSAAMADTKYIIETIADKDKDISLSDLAATTTTSFATGTIIGGATGAIGSYNFTKNQPPYYFKTDEEIAKILQPEQFDYSEEHVQQLYKTAREGNEEMLKYLDDILKTKGEDIDTETAKKLIDKMPLMDDTHVSDYYDYAKNHFYSRYLDESGKLNYTAFKNREIEIKEKIECYVKSKLGISQEAKSLIEQIRSGEIGVCEAARSNFSFDKISQIFHGPRLDSTLENYQFAIGDQNVSLVTDNNIVSQAYAQSNGFTNPNKVLTNGTMNRIQEALIHMKESGIKIPDKIYISDMFRISNELDSTAAGSFNYNIPDSIMVNLRYAKDTDWLSEIIFHETGHLNDHALAERGFWLSDGIEIDGKEIQVGKSLYVAGICIGNQTFNVTLDDGTIVTTEEIRNCIREYATSSNQEFVAEVTANLLNGKITLNEAGEYVFGRTIDTIKNLTSKESLNNIMKLYYVLTQGKIISLK